MIKLGLCTVLLLVVLVVAVATVVLGTSKPERLPISSALWLLLGCVFAAVAVVHFC